MPTMRWPPDRTAITDTWSNPPMLTAIGRGLKGRCPGCGQTRMFRRFLKVIDKCPNCTAPLGLARADDAPPYFTIFIVGHIIVPPMIIVDRMGEPPLWLMSLIFLPLTVILALGLIQPIKGGTVGLMLTLNMLKSDPNER
ncbi:MAG TPA: DUF983 domain-containing protein [Rhodopila sp.]|uniref:DUF983 domain-containing protein n=1 Tax=Rhodopila sp. TaxID=2480087 RepID=UPI002BC4618F|nr:DUF983 domain-containing protein [Rhodopila sp.]HVY18162.1 DUF983 domain-containing protein [Rhodopila sp.]